MLDIVTIAYTKELPYIEIQAKSIEQYVPHEQISSIIVIINDDLPNNAIDPAWFGSNQSKLIVKNYKDLDEDILLDGWNSQQLCKLLSTRLAKSDWSMILDAKTWFVRSFDVSMVLNGNKVKRHITNIDPLFSTERNFIENLYGVDLDQSIRCGVPFYIHNNSCKNLIDFFENFVDFFQKNVKNPPNVTEFLLYIGYLEHMKLTEDLYTNGYEFNDLNVADWQPEQFDRLLDEAINDSTVITFSVNSMTYPELTDDQISRWLDFLEDRSLISDSISTKNKLNSLYN